jgi:hypothetical protein
MTHDYIPSGPDFIPDYDFTQLLAEVMHRAGREAIANRHVLCPAVWLADPADAPR